MKMKMKKIGACVLVGCMAAALIMPTATTTAQAAKIKLNKTKVYILKGESVKLKIKGTKKKVTWKSSKKKVATVSKKGKVKAKKAGKATITAKVKGKKYKCKVIVETKKQRKKRLKKETAKKEAAKQAKQETKKKTGSESDANTDKSKGMTAAEKAARERKKAEENALAAAQILHGQIYDKSESAMTSLNGAYEITGANGKTYKCDATIEVDDSSPKQEFIFHWDCYDPSADNAHIDSISIIIDLISKAGTRTGTIRTNREGDVKCSGSITTEFSRKYKKGLLIESCEGSYEGYVDGSLHALYGEIPEGTQRTAQINKLYVTIEEAFGVFDRLLEPYGHSMKEIGFLDWN